MNIVISNVSDLFKMAKECFGLWHFKKKIQDLHVQNNWFRFRSHIVPCSFMAHKMQLVKPTSDFMSVTGGCKAHLIPCSMNPLEHLTGNTTVCVPSYRVHLLVTTSSANFGYKKTCNPLDRGSVVCDLRCTFGMAQLYNLLAASLESW